MAVFVLYHARVKMPLSSLSRQKHFFEAYSLKEDLILGSAGNLCGQSVFKIIYGDKQKSFLCVFPIFSISAGFYYIFITTLLLVSSFIQL